MTYYDDCLGEVELIDFMGNDMRAVHSARVSFAKSFNRDTELNTQDDKLLQYLIDNKHTSPLEHSSLSFRIKCPLFIARQVMRHRTFSYNEISRRYTSQRIEFYYPGELRQQATKNLQCSTDAQAHDHDRAIEIYHEACKKSLEHYQMLLLKGVCREQARGVLVQSMYTEFYMSGNLLNWLKFLDLRLDAHAQYEARLLAQAILVHIEKVFPVTVRHWFSKEW